MKYKISTQIIHPKGYFDVINITSLDKPMTLMLLWLFGKKMPCGDGDVLRYFLRYIYLIRAEM